MVFAVALMVAMVSRWQLTEFLTQEDFTMVKNPGTAEMEIITQEGGEVTRYRAEDVDDAAGPPRPAGRSRLPARRAGRSSTCPEAP